ncbi:MAG: cadmium-translocating P-type ATPase [Eggerthellaceae bacterium]|nr:cadmium-translocating P-type ATPase [Eggerthellaceae bacterium]
MNAKQLRLRNRIIVALAIFVIAYACELAGVFDILFGSAALWAEFAIFLIPFLIAGYDVIGRAARNIAHGHVFDENFLMSIATIGAFALVLFPDTEPHMAEGAAVMLFYQVGELFQSYAVGKSRKSISDMMDIAPDYANILVNGQIEQVDPYEVSPGDEIIIKAGERVPLDGVVVSGASMLDTAALTGESVPREITAGDDIISGCVNLNGTLTVKVTKPFEDSTVSRILELVENAADKKAKTENFITRFARYYTPAVVIVAVVLAVIPPLLGWGAWSDWILRGLTFLVVSCPCALVISIPLSFFGGIGGASKVGVLVKGSNYLEVLAEVKTMVFDKTGTLTNGTFDVVAIHPVDGISPEHLLKTAAYAESFSDHPIALSVKRAYEGVIDATRVKDAEEISGQGIKAVYEQSTVLAGNHLLMDANDIDYKDCKLVGTILYVAVDGRYIGHIVISDRIKPNAKSAIEALHEEGVGRCIMLTGDRNDVAEAVASELGLDGYRAQMLPADKVDEVESLINSADGKLGFVGDGINDAPVLTRADVGIAMGALGSDAAIEAADVVLMEDDPKSLVKAIKISKTTMRLVWENIIFALGVKFIVLILAALGIANMWMAVFADVGVAIIAILNAMRAMSVKRYK